MINIASFRIRRSLQIPTLSLAIIAHCTAPVVGQSSAGGQTGTVTGSVPSGSATSEVLNLTLRDAITQGLRYNLATIESGENARIARGQRLLALSELLPQISGKASENVEQLSLATLGLKKLPGVPPIIGPYGYSSVD